MAITEQNHGGVVFYRSELLHDTGGVAHGFSTRCGGVSEGQFASLNLWHNHGDQPERVLENYRRFCAAVGAELQRMVFTKQVHRDDIRRVTLEDAGKGLFRPRNWEVDGLVTNEVGLPLVVFSADCIPVLLYDPVARCIGACHAGWRGTALGIAGKLVRTLCAEYGARPEHIRAAIGPGISACCFETHADVPEAMLAALGTQAEPAIKSLENGKFLVDCKEINRTWLLNEGLDPEQIEVSDQCTCCQPRKFWTHRRMGTERGIMAAVIQLT